MAGTSPFREYHQGGHTLALFDILYSGLNGVECAAFALFVLSVYEDALAYLCDGAEERRLFDAGLADIADPGLLERDEHVEHTGMVRNDLVEPDRSALVHLTGIAMSLQTGVLVRLHCMVGGEEAVLEGHQGAADTDHPEVEAFQTGGEGFVQVGGAEGQLE